jgi:putative zinc finger/helix-turn-helix YgiT family protein
MKGICPNCEKETEIEKIAGNEEILVRGEPIKVNSIYCVCHECGVEFENTRNTSSLSEAYREYRRRHAMLQPEEIREWRKKYGLTQKELAALLGWGDVTLSRYENGALQDDAHEKILRLALEPHNLLKLVEESPNALSNTKHEQLVKELKSEEKMACSFSRLFEDVFAHYDPDEYSGYIKLNIQKLYNVILYFCQSGQLKTKLNKLLFYSDFKHFKEHTVSITGVRYAHLPFGPVPDNYSWYFAEMERDGRLSNEPENLGEYIGESYVALSKADLSIFNSDELATLEAINTYFSNYSAKEITEFSHQETGYIETPHAMNISYVHSESLKI